MPIQVFISYSRKDSRIAEYITDELSGQGVDVFLDKRNILAGVNFIDTLGQEIQNRDFFLPLISPRAISSKWVLAEIVWALCCEKAIVPLLLEPTSYTKIWPLIAIEWVDFTSSVRQFAIQKLAMALGLPSQENISPKETVSKPSSIDAPRRGYPKVEINTLEKPTSETSFATTFDSIKTSSASSTTLSIEENNKVQDENMSDNNEDPIFTPNDLDTLYSTASEQREQDIEKALQIYRSILLQDPDYKNGQLRTYVQLKDAELTQQRVETLKQKAQAAVQTGEWDIAKQHGFDILELDPNNKTAAEFIEAFPRLLTELLRQTESALNSGEWRRVGELGHEILELDPTHKEARCLLDLGLQLETISEKASVALKESRWDVAKEFGFDMLRLDPKSKVASSYIEAVPRRLVELLRRAETASESEEWKHAEELAQEMLELDPTWPEAHHFLESIMPARLSILRNRAEVALQAGAWKHVEELAQEMLELDPTWPEAQHVLSLIVPQKIIRMKTQAQSALEINGWGLANHLGRQILSLDTADTEAVQMVNLTELGQKAEDALRHANWNQAQNLAQDMLSLDQDNATAKFIVDLCTKDTLCNDIYKQAIVAAQNGNLSTVSSLLSQIDPICPDFRNRIGIFCHQSIQKDYLSRLQVVATLNDHGYGHVYDVAFSPTGNLLASAASDNTIRLWQIPDGYHLASLDTQNNPILSVDFSPDGMSLAAASKGEVSLWQVPEQELITKLEVSDKWIRSVAFSPDGTYLAAGGAACFVHLWRVPYYYFIDEFEVGGGINAISFSPDGRVLAVGSDSWNIGIYRVLDRKYLYHMEAPNEYSVRSLVFSPNNNLLASTASKAYLKGWGKRVHWVQLWQIPGGRPLVQLEHSKWVTSVAFSPDGDLLATSQEDGRVFLWNVSDGQLLKTLNAAASKVHSVAFSFDGTLLATASSDKTVKLWGLF